MPRYVRVAPRRRAELESDFDWGDAFGQAGRYARAGSALAGLAGQSGVSSGLGALAGPLGLATGIAEGNPWQSAIGGIQGASALSGYLGGPTLSSLLADAGAYVSSLLPSFGASVAAPVGAEAAAAGAGAGLGTLGLMLGPSLAMIGGAIGEQFAGPKRREMGQQIERQTYAQEWPGLTAARERGAGLMGLLGDVDTPEEITKALGVATRGIRANALAPAYSTLSGSSGDTGGHSMDLSDWAERAPELEGQNWAAWTALMDRAHNTGMGADADSMMAKSILGPRSRPSVHGGGTGEFLPSTSQYHPIKDYGKSSISLLGGLNSGEFFNESEGGTTTQRANDISNALAGIGQQLGVKWGDTPEYADGNWQNQGYTIRPDQLDSYGFTPGRTGIAALNYLSQIAPSVREHENWDDYATALGVTDDDLASMPQRLSRLAESPYERRRLDPWSSGVTP